MQYNQPFGVSDPNAAYINGNPATGTPGSIPPAASIEYDQREIVKAITDAQLATPTNNDLTQLSAAMRWMRPQYLFDQGGANSIVIQPSPSPPLWMMPFTFIVQLAATNTIAGVQISIVGIAGGVPVRNEHGTPLSPGDLQANAAYLCSYDGAMVRIFTNVRSSAPVQGLSANMDLYVNGATGNDSNNGLQATVGAPGVGPFQTIQKAANVVAITTLNGYTITIHVADWIGNTYAPVQLPILSGVGAAIIAGNDTTPGNVHIHAAIGPAVFSAVQGIAGWRIHGVRLSSAAAYSGPPYWPGAGLWIGGGGAIQVYNLEFGNCASAHILTQAKGFIQCLGGDAPGGTGFINVAGTAPVTLWADRNSEIDTDLVAFNLNLAISWSDAFAHASNGSVICCQVLSIGSPGNGTGIKARAEMNSVIYSVGTTIPGSLAATTATGGQTNVL
jgi:hypothetical protein